MNATSINLAGQQLAAANLSHPMGSANLLQQQQQQPLINIQTPAVQRQQQQQQQQQQQLLVLDSSNNKECNATGQQQASGNELIGYYFGSISRETAEWILRTHGNGMDGAYLLRSSGPNDDFVLSLLVVNSPQQQSQPSQQQQQQQPLPVAQNQRIGSATEVLHYKIVETEDSFVALHGQIGDEKFATIDELIERAQGVATKPRWPIDRQALESQILPPTFWGLTVDQVRLAILIKARQWGFPLLSTLLQQQQQQPNQDQAAAPNVNQNGDPNGSSGCGLLQMTQNGNTNGVSNSSNNSNTTLNNETIRTLIYKSLHEFQPWFHGKISRDEAERRIQEGPLKDGRFLVRERDNYSYAMCISHKKTTKHYRIDVLPTGELAIQDGKKFTSLMALVSHYTIMSDGLWCALTEACPRPIQRPNNNNNNNNVLSSDRQMNALNNGTEQINVQTALSYSSFNNPITLAQNRCQQQQQQNFYSVPPPRMPLHNIHNTIPVASNNGIDPIQAAGEIDRLGLKPMNGAGGGNNNDGTCKLQQVSCGALANGSTTNALCTTNGHNVASLKAPLKEWLQTINQKWTQLMNSKNPQSINSFLFGSQNPLNNHCRHSRRNHHHHHHHHHHSHQHHGHSTRHRKCKNGHVSCGCIQHQQPPPLQNQSLDPLSTGRIPLAGQSSIKSIASKQALPYCGGINMTAASTAGSLDSRSAIEPALRSGKCACCVGAISANNESATSKNLNPISASYQLACDYSQAGLMYPIGSMYQSSKQQQQLANVVPQSAAAGIGFGHNGQSFVGSPLFAVRASSMTQSIESNGNNHTVNLGSTGSTGGSSNTSNKASGSMSLAKNADRLDESNTGEGKLISPAQSISANLSAGLPASSNNNNNNQARDIYEISSGASTVLVNDGRRTIATSSSSSSAGNANHYRDSTTATVAATALPVAGFNSGTLSQLNKTGTLIKSLQDNNFASLLHQQQQIAAAAAAAAASRVGMTNVENNSMSLQAHGNNIDNSNRQQAAPTNRLNQDPSAAGPIVCGQHVGPAYRYTNCTDENSFKTCPHRQLVAYRSADDSQLMLPRTHLSGPAALTKFVQFQDGQCLRTHRDTQSIQMAYLTAARQASPAIQLGGDGGGGLKQAHRAAANHINGLVSHQIAQSAQSRNQHHANVVADCNRDNKPNGIQRQSCDRVLRNYDPSKQQQQQQQQPSHQINMMMQMWQQQQQQRCAPSHLQQQQQQPQRQQQAYQSHRQSTGETGRAPDVGSGHQKSQGQQAATCSSPRTSSTAMGLSGFQHHRDHTVDLMDCGSSSTSDDLGITDGFEFKYDPKLIKSSSIETLCGGGNAANEQDIDMNLDNFKTNSELLMALQPVFSNNVHHVDSSDHQQVADTILHPVACGPFANGCETSATNNTTNATAANGHYESSSGFSFNRAQTAQLNTGFNNKMTPDVAALACAVEAAFSAVSQTSGSTTTNEEFESMKKKHDLDELTTNMLAELTASLKAQVDLKNKRAGLSLPGETTTKQQSSYGRNEFVQQVDGANSLQVSSDPKQLNNGRNQQNCLDNLNMMNSAGQLGLNQDQIHTNSCIESSTNPRELVNEFDSLILNTNN